MTDFARASLPTQEQDSGLFLADAVGELGRDDHGMEDVEMVGRAQPMRGRVRLQRGSGHWLSWRESSRTSGAYLAMVASTASVSAAWSALRSAAYCAA